ncbi:MAG: hypothetical protein Q7S13_05135 [Candidatus Omnitrophota bacterium]|nr:hypothetical protein [Candidatus Omnitrophota bacterium]
MVKENGDRKILLQGVFKSTFFNELKKRGIKEAYVLEGRPTLESAKVTTKELLKQGITPILISDNMAGFLFYKKMLKEVWVSYQLADDNGAVCRIGGLVMGILGKKHHIPVNLYPAKEKSRLMGDQKEILFFNGKRVAPKNIAGYVPLVEWLPRKYISKRVN